MTDTQLWYFVPMVICLGVGWILQAFVDEQDNDPGTIISWIAIIPFLNIVIAGCILMFIGFLAIAAFVQLPFLIKKFRS